jgi:molybdopterin-binding protein
MKILAGTTLALALSVASMSPVLTGPAMAQTSNMTVGGQVTGQIESIDDSTVMVRMSDGTVRTYQIDSATVTSLGLSQGSTILLNRNLLSGEIIRIGPRNVLVKLDNGETRYFIVTREGRGRLSPGERVIITPNQTISSAEDYTLTAGDVTLVQQIATTTTDTTPTVRSTTIEEETTTTRTQVTTPTTPAPVESTTPPTTVEETQPVRALW